MARTERTGAALLNRPGPLLNAHDKLATALLLARAGIPQPRTAHVREAKVPETLRPPFVVKPRFGSWGQDVFRFYIRYGVGQTVPETANGLECQTCHDSVVEPVTIVDVPSVKFPSGVVRDEPGHDNVCETCHRGRESKATVDAQIATGKYKFMNVHYLAAGATKLGSAVHVGYEYDGKTYAGPLAHPGGTQCTSCHDPAGSHHTFQIADAWSGQCKSCDADANGDPHNIRLRHLAD